MEWRRNRCSTIQLGIMLWGPSVTLCICIMHEETSTPNLEESIRRKTEARGKWNPLKASAGDPQISHLLFVDNFIFCRESVNRVHFKRDFKAAMEWRRNQCSTIQLGIMLGGHSFTLCIPIMHEETSTPNSEESIRRKMEAKGKWKPLKASTGSPLISHLLFADDFLFVVEALMGSIEVSKECLSKFPKASGQSVNYEKSRIFFLPNLIEEKASVLCMVAIMTSIRDLGGYLEAKLVHNRCNKKTYICRSSCQIQYKARVGKLCAYFSRHISQVNFEHTTCFPNAAKQALASVLNNIDKITRRWVYREMSKERRCIL